MAIAGVSTANRAADQQSRIPQKALGKDDFMRLLIAQMQNQDPMQPMEDKEFILQMAQLTSLEEMQSLNNNMSAFLTNQIARQNEMELIGALGLIGMQVEAQAPDTGETLSSTVTGIKIISGLIHLVLAGREEPVPAYAMQGVYQNSNNSVSASEAVPVEEVVPAEELVPEEGGAPVDQQS